MPAKWLRPICESDGFYKRMNSNVLGSVKYLFVFSEFISNMHTNNMNMVQAQEVLLSVQMH